MPELVVAMLVISQWRGGDIILLLNDTPENGRIRDCDAAVE